MADERSNRIRERRKQSEEKRDQPDGMSQSSEPAKQSVKDQRPSIYMYVPEEQKAKLAYLFDTKKAEVRREFDVELEKNRHWYPLAIQYGLDGLEGSDPLDIKTMLTDLDLWPGSNS